jgi:hypothetical protein
VTSKFSWEPLDRGSLLLRITDGDRETTWKIRKNTSIDKVRMIFDEMTDELGATNVELHSWEWAGTPMPETVRTVDAEELAELQGYQPIQETSEEASRAAQAARVAKLNIGAKWFEADDDETYGIPIPDYDTGEIK